MTRSARVGFAGTPEFAAVALRALLAAGQRPAVVYTQPDRPAGRGRRLQTSPVKRCALEYGLTLRQPASLRDADARQRFEAERLDLLIVAAYGLLLPPHVLDAPRRGCLNIHASLLPRWRGAAPIQRALLAGDTTTGISLMQMDAGLDTGPVLEQRPLSVAADDTAGALHDRLARLGAERLLARLPEIIAGTLPAVEQSRLPGEPSYAAKLTKQEARLDWRTPAAQLDRQIRAYNPWPVAYSELDGERLRVLTAAPSDGGDTPPAPPGTVVAESSAGLIVACGGAGDQRIALTELQWAGKKPQPVQLVLRSRSLLGRRFAPVPES